MTPRKPKQKNPHATALGSKGGKARAKKLTPERRSEIARLGAEKTNALRAASKRKARAKGKAAA